MAQLVKNLPANVGDTRDVGSMPGSGRSPRVGNGNPFQYWSLENSTEEPGGYSPCGCKGSDTAERGSTAHWTFLATDWELDHICPWEKAVEKINWGSSHETLRQSCSLVPCSQLGLTLRSPGHLQKRKKQTNKKKPPVDVYLFQNKRLKIIHWLLGPTPGDCDLSLGCSAHRSRFWEAPLLIIMHRKAQN